ncbi:MAG: hypothetical protein J6B62_00075 [Bacteroidales bacterium]|nr:hypothetical protein [Bacteroidales bacterium]
MLLYDALHGLVDRQHEVISVGRFNILLILGTSSIITPLKPGGLTIVDYMVMICAAVLPALLGIRGRIPRAGGIVLLLVFIAYNAYLINMQLA